MALRASVPTAHVAFGPKDTGRLTATRRGCMTVAMAHPRRAAKVAKQIEREVGQLLITDKILQEAVCPERARGFDGALSALASVTEVQISGDLQVAKVYLSIYSDEPGKAVAMEGLQRLEGYVRKHIGRQIRLRLTPEIRFVRDDSIERSERIFQLLDQVKRIERGEAEPPPLAFAGDYDEEEESESEDESDEDEGDFRTVDLGMFDSPSEASTSSKKAAGGGSGGGPKGKQQQQQQQKQKPGGQQQAAARAAAVAKVAASDAAAKKGAGGGEEDMQEMLATFKKQMELRRGQL